MLSSFLQGYFLRRRSSRYHRAFDDLGSGNETEKKECDAANISTDLKFHVLFLRLCAGKQDQVLGSIS